jgi:hypothetical protein
MTFDDTEVINDGEVICLGFVNSSTMIGEYVKETDGLNNAFFVSLVRNPESKERNFYFKPALPCSVSQYIYGSGLARLIDSGSVLTLYRPAKTVLNAYRYFIDNEEIVGRVLQDHLYECGPSKEFVDKIMADMPKPTPREEDGVIKGLFGPTFRNICDDDEGQS